MKTKLLLLSAALAACICAEAEFAAPPKAAVKALKITRGRPFGSGVVFIDGKYIPPPYTIERYGLVLRVNGIQATGPLVPWEEFLKIQEGVKVSTSTEPAAVQAPPAPAPAAPPPPAVDDDPLADLFDDEPVAKKPAAKKPAYTPRARKPAVTTTYSFDGEFAHNDASKALVSRINQSRTELDAHLRRGGFACFGSSYSRVTGDAGATKKILSCLPELMRSSTTQEAFSSGIRSAGIVYFPEALNKELFQNRVDYLKLMERRRAIEEEDKLNALLKGRTF